MQKLISEKLWDKVPWEKVDTRILLERDESGSSMLKRIAEGGHLHSLPISMLNEDLFFSDIAREEKIIEFSANSGELAFLDQISKNIFSEVNIIKYKLDIVRAIFSATIHNTISMLPKRLIRDDLFEMIIPPNLTSPLHNALRLGNMSAIPDRFFSIKKLFAIQGDGKNILSYILDKSEEGRLRKEERALLLRLAHRIPLSAIGILIAAYPQLRTTLLIENMRRVAEEKNEDSLFLCSKFRDCQNR